MLAVGGAIFIAWSYRRTLRALPPAARIPLTMLRAAITLLVLLCLANPVRVERRPPEPSARDTLAVVVDRSDSMTAADHRGVTRLAAATQLWKQHEAQADKAFPRTVYRHFAVAAAADASLDAALRAERARAGNPPLRRAPPDARTHAGGHRLPHRRVGHHGRQRRSSSRRKRNGAACRLYFALGANRALPGNG